MKLIYRKYEYDENGQPVFTDGVGVLTPIQGYLDSLPADWPEEKKLVHIANKDLPTGTPYEVADNPIILADRSEREGWTYEAGPNEKVSQDFVEGVY